MKKLFILLLISLYPILHFGQSVDTRNFTVGGDIEKFYPVVFSDMNWSYSSTDLEITRPSVHTNSSWRGSLIAKFRFHTTRWGHGSHFCDCDIKQNKKSFVADYHDATGGNATFDFIIWLRGGGTTYTFRYLHSAIADPRVYDGEINALPFHESNGAQHSYRTEVNPDLNQYGKTLHYTSNFLGTGVNYFAGEIGLGTPNTNGNKLAVAGNIAIDGILKAKEVKVQTDVWADYVFDENYELKSLSELQNYIEENGHLPGVPSGDEVIEKGISVAEMNVKLLEKIEELVVYTLQQEEKIIDQQVQMQEQTKQINSLKLLEERVSALENSNK
jgi:hypothetical protein